MSVRTEVAPSTWISGRFRSGMLLPGMLVAALIASALALVLFLALRSNDRSLLGGGFSLSNFQTIAVDPLIWIVVQRSILIAAVVTAATIVTAYPVAYFLAFKAGRFSGLLLFLVVLPFWTSYLLR